MQLTSTYHKYYIIISLSKFACLLQSVLSALRNHLSPQLQEASLVNVVENTFLTSAYFILLVL